MTTRSNTIVRPGGLLRWALCLAALVSLLPLRAADDAPARKVAGELAARFRAMKAYTVTFAVEGDDFAAEGSYAVEGDRYYMRVGDAEAYSDGVSKWEVDPSKREVVVDVVDTQSRSLLGNPTRAFDFLDDAFRSWGRDQDRYLELIEFFLQVEPQRKLRFFCAATQGYLKL